MDSNIKHFVSVIFFWNIKHLVPADEIQKAFGTEWQFKANRFCEKKGILKKLRFSSLKKAKKECAANAECTMVVRVGGEKSKMFLLCKGVSINPPPKGPTAGSCAYYDLKKYDADDLTIWVKHYWIVLFEVLLNFIEFVTNHNVKYLDIKL